MRYLMATSWSRDSIWISLALRSSALKMVVSTSLITGAILLSVELSLSMDSVSSESPSSATTSSAKPSVTSSSTRCDCSVFFSSSEICESVATLTRSLRFNSSVNSSIRFRFRGSERAISRVPFCAFIGTKLYRNIKSTGIDRKRSWSMVPSRRSTYSHRYRAASARACSASDAVSDKRTLSIVAINNHLVNRIRQRKNRQIQRDQNERHKRPHHNHDGRLDQRQHRRHARVHVFLKKLRHAVQHRRQRAGRFAYLDHVDRKRRKHLRCLQRPRKRLPFAHAL